MKLKKFLSLLMVVMMCATLFIISGIAESAVTLENISATKSEIMLDYSAAVSDGAFTLTQGGETVAASVSKTNNGKTIVITPEEELELDKVYVIHATGCSDEFGETVAGFFKAFKLEKIFADDFSTTTTATLSDKFKSGVAGVGVDATFNTTNFYVENEQLVLNLRTDPRSYIKSNFNTPSGAYSVVTEMDVDFDINYSSNPMGASIVDGKSNTWLLKRYINDAYGETGNCYKIGAWYNSEKKVVLENEICTASDGNPDKYIGAYKDGGYHWKDITTFDENKNGEYVVSIDGTEYLRTNIAPAKYTPYFMALMNDTPRTPVYIDNIVAYKVAILSEISDIATPDITGDFEVGNTVECSVMCDDEIISSFNVSYQWYRCDDYFSDIPELIENANSQSYTITNDDVGKNLFCEVTFIHKTLTDFKILLESEVTLEPFPPVVRNYKLVYNKDENLVETLTVKYEYFDANNDKRVNEVFVWEESATGEEDSWTLMSEASGKYVIQSTDINKYIRCTLTVENEISETSEPVTDIYKMPFAPTEKDGIVTISGSAVVGETLTAVYDYFDNDGDKEGESKRNWYRVDSLGNRVLIASGSTAYGVKAEDCGYGIQFGYKPVSVVYPEEGTEVFSNKIEIPAITVNSGGGYTGSFSGGGGSSSVTVTKHAPKEETTESESVSKEETPKNPEQPKTDIGNVFSDMKTHWSKEYVAFLYEKGLVNGRGDGYCPEDKVTRAEWVTMMLRSIEKDGQESYDNCFADINVSDWYAKDIQTAFSLGIINGSDNGFMPNENITREQMAKIAIDTYELVKGEIEDKDDLSKFTDSEDVSEWAVSYMEKAIKLGIITGMSENSLSPKGVATRAEAAAVLSRVYNLIMSK